MCATDPYLWRVSPNMTDQLLTGFNEHSISRNGSYIHVSVHNQCQNVVFFITAIGVCFTFYFLLHVHICHSNYKTNEISSTSVCLLFVLLLA